MIKTVFWFFLANAVALAVSLLDAALNVLFFNLSGVDTLADLGYWSLFWINIAVVNTVGTAAGIALSTRAFGSKTYDELEDIGRKFDTL